MSGANAPQHPLLDFSQPVGLISGEAPRFESVPGGHEALKHDLHTMGVPFQETEGRYGGPERSFIVHGLPKEVLMSLGRKFGQESVVHSEGGRRELIYTNGPNTGLAHPGLPGHEHWPEGAEPPEDYYTKLPGQGYVRLAFDFDRKEPVHSVQNSPPLPAASHAPGPFYGKHELGHAIYQTLKKAVDDAALAKTSNNVKMRRRFQFAPGANEPEKYASGRPIPLSSAQVSDRRKRYAESIGLKPTYGVGEGSSSGGFPSAGGGNQLPYNDTFDIAHEAGHAVMTPEDQTLSEYQKWLTARADNPLSSSDDLVDDDELDEHEAGLHHENVANAAETHIDRRAGLDPHAFQSQYRSNMRTAFNDDGEGLYDPKSGGVVSVSSQPRGTGYNRGYGTNVVHNGKMPIPAEHIREEARHHVQGFDEGKRFGARGEVVQPTGVDAKINARARSVKLPGQHLFKAEALAKAYVTHAQLEREALKVPFRHPHAYDWHDGYTGHHYRGSHSGGVLVSLQKHDAHAPQKHPHTDGAIPGGDESKRVANDQAAGVGVKTYHQFAVPFGHIDHEARGRGGSNLFHYDYNGKNDAVNKLVASHGFEPYYAGGKFGKPDLANRNYNTRHLMIYDPTDEGGRTGDPTYADSWRKVHELAHALTYPEINKIYGEGRRIGKLGHHRSEREALRAVHWEHLAAHKQRELNRSLGIDVPDEVFNRELNTVMHDAAHRAVTGKFTEPSGEGFVPHAHAVPLETSLGMVRAAARNLGLVGMDDTIKKSERSKNVAEKELTIPETLHALHKSLKEKLGDMEQKCLELRKAELAKKSPPGRKKEVEDLKAKGLPASEAFGIAWKQQDEKGKPVKKTAVTAGGMGDMGGAPAPNVGEMAMAEKGSEALCKLCDMKKSLCKCESMEKYAKGESRMSKDELKVAGPAPAGASPDAPGPKDGVLPGDKPEKVQAESSAEGSGGKVMKKAAPGMAAPGAMPAAPKAPAAAGGVKPPSVPGMGAGAAKPAAMAKPAAAPKTPALGAGTPQMKAELTKNFGAAPPTVAAKAPALGNAPTMAAPAPTMHEPPLTPLVPQGQTAAQQGAAIKGFLGSKNAPGRQGPALPGAHLFGKTEIKKWEPGTGLTPSPAPQLPQAKPGAGSFGLTPAPQLQGPAKGPAQAQSMVERVASRMPQGGSALSPSVPGRSVGLPGQHLFAPKAPAGAPAMKSEDAPKKRPPRLIHMAVPGSGNKDGMNVRAHCGTREGLMDQGHHPEEVTCPDCKAKMAESTKKAELKKEHVGFNKLAGELAHEKGVENPKAVAAAIGRKKYGAKGMAEKAAKGKKG